MNEAPIIIRAATLDDAPALHAIYAPYVEETAITFEYDVPSVEDFAARMERTLAHYPYLVAEQDGRALGYAYCGPFAERAAYGWAAETSVYLKRGARKQGLGRRLYEALERVSAAQGIVSLYACIAVPTNDEPDPYLDRNSVGFHEHLGYRLVGEFRACGFKFDRWYSMVWMEKALQERPVSPTPLIPFPSLDGKTLCELGIQP